MVLTCFFHQFDILISFYILYWLIAWLFDLILIIVIVKRACFVSASSAIERHLLRVVILKSFFIYSILFNYIEYNCIEFYNILYQHFIAWNFTVYYNNDNNYLYSALSYVTQIAVTQIECNTIYLTREKKNATSWKW